MGEERRDFFISYTSADRTWAEWIAWELETAGYTTLIQAWDFRPGTDWAVKMQEGTTEWSRILAVLSPHFFESKFTSAEWTSVFAKDPTGELGLLIPVRVAECEPTGLLRARTFVDLVGLGEDAVRKKLLDGVKQGRAKPADTPSFPGWAKPKPQFPLTKIEAERQTKGETSQQTQAAPAMPRKIHNLPFRHNPVFIGRAAELKELHRKLRRRRKEAAIQVVVVHGLGGVGKTQLAVEYAWKYLRGYDAVLWMKADSLEALNGGLAALAFVLRLPEAGEREQAMQIGAVLKWLSEHEGWLLIASDAETDEAVSALFGRLTPSLPGKLLVTSRISNWPVEYQELEILPLSLDAATDYLLKRIPKGKYNAGDKAAARSLADKLGDLPLALEQAASFIIEVKWTFEKFEKAFREAELGGTDYPVSIAKTWSITLERLSPLGHVLLRLAAWFAPDLIPRNIFSAKKGVVSEALGKEVSDLAIDKALGELDRFSLVRLTPEWVSVFRLLQAVKQDLTESERERWLVWAIRLFNAFAPESPDDVRTWHIWLTLSPHAETLIEHTKRCHVDVLPSALMANQFGMFLIARGVYAQAEPLLERALAIREKTLGRENPDVATSLNNLALLYYKQGQYAKAEPLYLRALVIREKALGPEDPNVAHSLNNLARLYYKQGQYAKAEPLYSKGQYAKAEPLYRRALAIREKALGPEHPDVAISRNNLALLYDRQGQYAKAEPLYGRALAIREKALGPEHPDVAWSLKNLAALYKAQGRYAEAEPLYERALSILEKAFGSEHQKVMTCLENYALCLQAMGRSEEAVALESRVRAIGLTKSA